MDHAMADQVENFVSQKVGQHQAIAKAALVRLADSSNLPQDVKDAIADLPDGEWTRHDLIGVVRESAKAEAAGTEEAEAEGEPEA